MAEVNNAAKTISDYFRGGNKTEDAPKPKATCESYTRSEVKNMTDKELFGAAVYQSGFGSKECAQLVKAELKSRGYKSGD